uniref:Gamma-glutamylcyclotransferase AIG2-like domain-containing protein n=1 Tax=Alexandrium catenella TaxID=2925 RepID=A0A7S1RBN0_ALECA
MMEHAGSGHRISGEVFLVDDDALEALDLLEGVQTGRYYRREVPVRLGGPGDEMLCAVYFAKATEELLALPCCPDYTAEHNAAYCPKPTRGDILALCSAPAPEAHLAPECRSLPLQAVAVR